MTGILNLFACKGEVLEITIRKRTRTPIGWVIRVLAVICGLVLKLIGHRREGQINIGGHEDPYRWIEIIIEGSWVRFCLAVEVWMSRWFGRRMTIVVTFDKAVHPHGMYRAVLKGYSLTEIATSSGGAVVELLRLLHSHGLSSVKEHYRIVGL